MCGRIETTQSQDDLQLLVKKEHDEAKLWVEINLNQEEENSITKQPEEVIEGRWWRSSEGSLMCNVSFSWVNNTSLFGGAWILRDNLGQAFFHGRDAFTPMGCRMTAEFQYVIWTMECLRDVHMSRVEIASENASVIDVISQPRDWPRYRNLLDKVHALMNGFDECDILLVRPAANSVARAIARSITRDGRFQFYMAFGGPVWLHNQVLDDVRS